MTTTINVSKVSVQEKRFDPDQPRWPAGDERGGQWRPAGGGAQATGNDDQPPERRPWDLTPEQWEKHVASRAGYPGLPPHPPDWREREGLLPGRLDWRAELVEEDPWYGDRYKYSFGSPHTPDTEDVTLDLTSEEWSRDGVRKLREYRVDRSIAEMVVDDNDGWPTGRLRLKDDRYTDKFPVIFESNEPDAGNGIWRGMSGEEAAGVFTNGHVQSRQTHNLIGQEGLTYYSIRPSQALNYADGFAPWTHKPTFETPSYVVRVNRPEESRTRINRQTPDEVGVTGRIPSGAITEIWEVRLAAEKRGDGGLRISPHTGAIDEGSSTAPTQWTVYRKVPKEEWSQIKPYHARMRDRKS